MTSKQKKTVLRILAAAVLLIVLYFLPLSRTYRIAAYLLPYLLIGYDVLWKALRGVFRGSLLDENFLMSIASVGAYIMGDMTEAVVVMLFYQIGTLFESYAVGKSRRSIAALMDLRPDHANVERNGEICTVSPDEVEIGEIILVKTGERVPLDGTVIEGTAFADTSALTGESRPRAVAAGDEISSGFVSLGLLRVKVTRAFEDSAVSRVLALVENASTKKAKAENFITKFSKVYTPAVVAAAVMLTVLPPLFDGQWREWLTRALTFLVISCPCALVISVPLSFFGGIGGASKCGILVKGGNYLEALARVKTVVFDKTGTLTKGEFAVSEIVSEGVTKEELLFFAAAAEEYSSHPIAHSLKAAYGKEPDPARVKNTEEKIGRGVIAQVDAHRIAVGNLKLMQDEGAAPAPVKAMGTVIYVAKDGNLLGHIVISDGIKEDAASAIAGLRALGVTKTVLLTGDRAETGNAVAEALRMDKAICELLPDGKVACMESLLAENQVGTVAFVGDGINDAPVLTRVDVGIAMGGVGSDAAIEAADVVLMNDAPSKLVTAVAIARRTLAIVKSNIVFALFVKAVVLTLGALGFASMWAAVFADVGVSVLAILNAMRALSVKRYLR